MRRLRFWVAAVLVIGCGAYFLLFWPLRDPHPSVRPGHGTIAIRDAKIYPSPDVVPIEHGTLLAPAH